MMIVVNLFLLIMSLYDIKYKKMSLRGLLLFLLIGIIYGVFSNKHNMMLVIGGILLGSIFIFISFITREMIGYGDSLLFLSLGAWMGIDYLLGVCCVAFILGFFLAAVLMIMGRNRKSTIPFVPLIFIGSLFMTYRGLK